MEFFCLLAVRPLSTVEFSSRRKVSTRCREVRSRCVASCSDVALGTDIALVYSELFGSVCSR